MIDNEILLKTGLRVFIVPTHNEYSVYFGTTGENKHLSY